MLQITSDQWLEWLGLYFWPLLRILALISTAPILSERAIPKRVKIGLAILITIIVAPTLPPVNVPIFSAPALWVGLQQILIGVAIGFTMQFAFAAVRMAGELIGLQMGLSFATFFDPGSRLNMPIIARIIDDAGDVDPFLKTHQSPAYLTIRAGDSRDFMASGAAVSTKDRWCSGGIAASGQHARDLQSLLRSLYPVYADHSAKYCNGCRTQPDTAVSIMGGCAEHRPLPYRHLLSIALPLRAQRRRKSSRLEST